MHVNIRGQSFHLNALESTLAATSLAGIRLWLVLGQAPNAEVEELLRSQHEDWWDLPEAVRVRRRHRRRPAGDLGSDVTLGQTTSELARLAVFTRTRTVEVDERDQLRRQHTRMTVEPALRALTELLGTEAHAARTRVADVSPDGRSVACEGRCVAVPIALREVLMRQRLNALVTGQGPDDPC